MVKSNVAYICVILIRIISPEQNCIILREEIWFELSCMLSAFRRRIASTLRQRREDTWKGQRGNRKSWRGDIWLGRIPIKGRPSRGKRYLRFRLSRLESYQQDDDVHHMSHLFIHCAYFDVHFWWVKRQRRLISTTSIIILVKNRKTFDNWSRMDNLII